MKKFIIIIVVLFFVKIGFSQPNWNVVPSSYQYSMTITGVGLIGCQNNVQPNDLVAVFEGAICKGSIDFGTNVNGQNIAYLIAYSNVSQGDVLTFKMYDVSEDLIIDLQDTVIFEENASLGLANNPYVFSNTNSPTSLNLNDIIITDVSVLDDTIGMFETIDLDNDLFSYAFINSSNNDNSQFYISGDYLILQVDVDYLLQSEYEVAVEATDINGCSISNSFIFLVNNTNEGPTDLNLKNDPAEIKENESVGTLINGFVIEDLTAIDIHVITLEGDSLDNTSFYIDNNELYSNEVFDYETKNKFEIVLRVTDGVNNYLIKEFEVFVKDVLEFDDLKVTNFITPNEDGLNDYFAIPNPELFSEYTLMIFNDNGNNVYTKERNYDNSWNGLTNNGAELPSATYYYTFQRGAEFNKFIGKITILRNSKF